MYTYYICIQTTQHYIRVNGSRTMIVLISALFRLFGINIVVNYKINSLTVSFYLFFYRSFQEAVLIRGVHVLHYHQLQSVWYILTIRYRVHETKMFLVNIMILEHIDDARIQCLIKKFDFKLSSRSCWIIDREEFFPPKQFFFLSPNSSKNS